MAPRLAFFKALVIMIADPSPFEDKQFNQSKIYTEENMFTATKGHYMKTEDCKCFAILER